MEAGVTIAAMAKRRGPLKVDPVAEATNQWAIHGYDSGPRLQASLSLLRAESIVRDRNVEVLRAYGLSFGQHEVLMLLSFTRKGELPLGKIGERLMVHPTSVSNSVDALAEVGLVQRLADPADRRSRLARITRRGRNVARRTAASLADVQFGLAELDEAEASELFRILLKLRTNDFECADVEPTVTAAANTDTGRTHLAVGRPRSATRGRRAAGTRSEQVGQR